MNHLYLNLPEHEKLTTCPYNKAHQVVKHRMPMHLIKCRRSHTSAGTQECRFDSSHVVAIEEIKEHEENCPGRVNVELFMASDASNQKQTQVVSVNSTISLTSTVQSRPDEENWDNQAAVPSYNYKKKVNNSDCLRNIQHGTPSQMKMWREKEHHRISNIREFENISSASNMDMTSSASSTLP